MYYIPSALFQDLGSPILKMAGATQWNKDTFLSYYLEESPLGTENTNPDLTWVQNELVLQ